VIPGSGHQGAQAGAAGRGLFLMSGATTTFNIAGTYATTDNVADDSLGALSGGAFVPGNGAGAAITKQGAGTLILSAADNTYSGATTIEAGTVQLDGSLTASPTTVNSGGTLAGVGFAQGVTLNSGGIIAPGDSPGTLHATDLTWNGGGAIDFRLGATDTSTDSDLLALSGALTKGTSGTYVFHFRQGNGLPTSGTTYTLIEAASTTFAAGDFSFDCVAPLSLAGNFLISGNNAQFTITSATTDRIFANGFE